MRALATLTALAALTLPFQALAGTVEGRVFDARGRAAAGVELVLGDARTVSAADGSYRFADAVAGEQQLRAGSQAVVVTVPQEGAVQRNLFLLSQAARARVAGEPLAANSAEVLAASAAAAALLLAEADGLPTRRLADSEG